MRPATRTSPPVSLHPLPAARARASHPDLLIRHGIAPSPFGRCLVASCTDGLCALHFAGSSANLRQALDSLHHRFPDARLQRDDDHARDWVARIFPATPRPHPAPIPLALRGTPFELQVWRALLLIPSGATSTYSKIAEAVGRPNAARAVGRAVGRNPIAYLIPCHRVIRNDGSLGGYRWGAPRKRAMLAREL